MAGRANAPRLREWQFQLAGSALAFAGLLALSQTSASAVVEELTP